MIIKWDDSIYKDSFKHRMSLIFGDNFLGFQRSVREPRNPTEYNSGKKTIPYVTLWIMPFTATENNIFMIEEIEYRKIGINKIRLEEGDMLILDDDYTDIGFVIHKSTFTNKVEISSIAHSRLCYATSYLYSSFMRDRGEISCDTKNFYFNKDL